MMDFLLNSIFMFLGLCLGIFFGATVGYNAAVDKLTEYLKTVHGIDWRNNGNNQQ